MGYVLKDLFSLYFPKVLFNETVFEVPLVNFVTAPMVENEV